MLIETHEQKALTSLQTNGRGLKTKCNYSVFLILKNAALSKYYSLSIILLTSERIR